MLSTSNLCCGLELDGVQKYQGFQEPGWNSFPVLVGSLLVSSADLNDGAEACSSAAVTLCK